MPCTNRRLYKYLTSVAITASETRYKSPKASNPLRVYVAFGGGSVVEGAGARGTTNIGMYDWAQ